MNNGIWIDSTGEWHWMSEPDIDDEVFEYLAGFDREEESRSRADRRHIAPDIPPEIVQGERECTARDHIPNLLIRQEVQEVAEVAVAKLPEDMQRLYHQRYGCEMTEQAIANAEGVTKMAICKRLKRLHKEMRAALPDWPAEDFAVGA